MISSALRGLAASFLATAPQTAALRATAAIPSLLSQSFFCTTTTEAPASQAPKAQTPKENAGADPTKQKIYCGNLAWAVRSNDLEQLFSKYGKVHDAVVLMDSRSQMSRGFGFVTLDKEAAKQAISEVNATDFQGRAIKVSEVQETSQVRDKPRYNKHRYASVGDRSNDGPNDRYSDRRGGSRQQLRGGDEWGSDRPRGERPYYNKRRDSGDGGDRRGRREGGDNTRE